MSNPLAVVSLAGALIAAPALFAQSPAAAILDEPANTPIAAAAQPPTTPGARIVRLSQVMGDVQLDRDTGHGYEAAYANLPIVQGSRLRTGNGVAEVEFEDNSSIRLTPNTTVEFPVLASDAGGGRNSTVHIAAGEVYASMNKSVGNSVNLSFGRETLALGPSAHLRLAVTGAQPRLDVMDGTVEANNGVRTTEVGHKKALLFDPAGTNPPVLTGKIDKGQFSEWDKQEAEYHHRLMPSGGHFAGTPYAYGLADMNYYGRFTNMGGCGMMWRPYMVSASWSPFSNGTWAWYQNAGYSWVSPYPWGWTAFHSGSWNYCPGTGWGWQSGSSWASLRNTRLLKSSQRIKPPTQRPRPVGPTLIEVNEKPLVVSRLHQDNFVFRRDSAGLGVPRLTFGRLDHISSGVARQGAIARTVIYSGTVAPSPHVNAAFSSANRGMASTSSVPMTAHSTASSAPVSSGFSGGGMHGGPAMSAGGSHH